MSNLVDRRDRTDETPLRAGSGRSVRLDQPIPRRLLVSLSEYVAQGSHKAAAHRLGISESTSRQRVSQLMRLIEARTAAEAVWLLREELGREPWRGPRLMERHDP